MSSKLPTVLIAEDEDLARDRVRRIVAAQAGFKLGALCRNGQQAKQALVAGEVDIAILDIQMPGFTGMELLAASHREGRPCVILTTAYPQYAIDAFAGRAVDYVLKPFTSERLLAALEAAKTHLQAQAAMGITQAIRALVDGQPTATPAVGGGGSGQIPGCWLVREQGRIVMLEEHDIDWVKADGRYCIIKYRLDEHRIEGPFAIIVRRLCRGRFVQINRSIVVNVDRIDGVLELCKAHLVLRLKSGAEVAISRRFRKAFLAKLGSHGSLR